MDLNTVSFALLCVMVTGYAVLDGFDLGVGALTLFARSSGERDLMVAAIDPVWGGNQVWLLATGNVLFAAFPLVFTMVFSRLYLAVILLLAGLIARNVAIEFRRMHSSSRWGRSWDRILGVGCLSIAVILGAALGNVMRGMPVGPGLTWQGGVLEFLNPYALLVGILSGTLFIMHGAIYLGVKTTGELSRRMRRVALAAYSAFVALYLATVTAGMYVSPFLFSKAGAVSFKALAVLLAAALCAIPAAILSGRKKAAFLASSASIVLMLSGLAFSLHPILVPSTIDPEMSLTIYNSASAPATMAAMNMVGSVGIPIMLGYTLLIYRAFRGAVRI